MITFEDILACKKIRKNDWPENLYAIFQSNGSRLYFNIYNQIGFCGLGEISMIENLNDLSLYEEPKPKQKQTYNFWEAYQLMKEGRKVRPIDYDLKYVYLYKKQKEDGVNAHFRTIKKNGERFVMSQIPPAMLDSKWELYDE